MYTQPLRTTRLWIALSAALLCSGAALAQGALVDPPDRVARLSHVEGTVSLAPAAADQWVVALLNRPLTSGDRVWVDAASRAELQVDAATIHLDENTSLSFVTLDDDTIRMRLTDGAIVIHVRSLGARETLVVETNNASVALRQAGEYAVVADASGQTIVKTRRGECDVSGAPPQSYLVGANQQGVFTGDPLQADWVSLAPRNAFEIWSNVREDRASSSVGARYVAAGTIGYQDLDTYGSWSHEPEYGAVWRPTRIARDWAPYRYGRWVWVSPWGWTWIDDARWGFAPFHYGRWAYVRQHWCWVPGPPRARAIYAPALVAWAGDPGRHFNSVGWFPLGPRDFYLPGYQASWRHFRGINAGNVAWADEATLANAYRGRGTAFDYRNRRAPHALTVVPRDAFVSGQRTRGPGVRVEPNTAQRFREQGRAPEIQPNRLSVLGAEPTRHPPVARQERYSKKGGQSDLRGTLTPIPAQAAPAIDRVASPALTARPQRHAERSNPRARAWTSRANAPAAEPGNPERHAGALLGYTNAPKGPPLPAPPTAIGAPSPTPALPARARVEPRLHEQMRGQNTAARKWAPTPGADGQAPAAIPRGSGRAERAPRDPGAARSGFRVAPRGGGAAPRDLTR